MSRKETCVMEWIVETLYDSTVLEHSTYPRALTAFPCPRKNMPRGCSGKSFKARWNFHLVFMRSTNFTTNVIVTPTATVEKMSNTEYIVLIIVINYKTLFIWPNVCLQVVYGCCTAVHLMYKINIAYSTYIGHRVMVVSSRHSQSGCSIPLGGTPIGRYTRLSTDPLFCRGYLRPNRT